MLMPHGALADAVLMVHAGIVLFVVLGLPAIVLGNWWGWSWVNRRSWRLAHVAAIGVVVVQAWLGRFCILTDIESSLRQQAGEAGYATGFVAHWVQQVLYHDAPMWVFPLAYTVFGLLVALAWWRYPPVRSAAMPAAAPRPMGNGIARRRG